MTEEERAAQKAKPVATTPIPGTPWYAPPSPDLTQNPSCYWPHPTFP